MIRDLARLPKRKVTVDELLGRDDIVRVLQIASQSLEDIQHIGVVILLKDGSCETHWSDTPTSTAVWMLEDCKHQIFHAEDDDACR